MQTNNPHFKSIENAEKYFKAYDEAMSLWPVPYQVLFVETEWGKTHVIASGPEQGPVVVLLHGLGASSTTWYKNIGALAQSHRVYAIDIIGTASKSVCVKALANLAESVSWLNQVFDHLGIHKAHLIGHSYGGFISINFAIQCPAKIHSLILLAPAASLKSLTLQFFLRGLLMMIVPWRPIIIWVLNWFGGNGSAGLSEEEPFVKQMILAIQIFKSKLKFPPRVYTDTELQRLNMPTLVMVGSREVIYDPDAALKRAETTIPACDVLKVLNAGHALQVDEPELVNKAILDFIAKVD